MSFDEIAYQLFTLFLFITMLLSGYLFFRSIQIKSKGYVNSWQFPMLLALMFDHVYVFHGFVEAATK